VTMSELARDVLMTMFEGNTATGATGKEFKTSHTSIPIEAGEYLTDLTTALGAPHTIEVGLGLGISTIFLVSGGNRSGMRSHVAIDPYQDSVWDQAGVLALERAQIKHLVTLVQEPSELYLPSVLRSGSRFNLAFVDGDHHFEHVFIDLYFVSRCLTKEGVIVVDDVYLASVRTAVEYFVRNLRWQIIDRPFIYDDIGRERLLTLEPKFDTNRQWDDFVPFT
jgi:predicted O-methyltransferase YrrM